ncbi:MAG: periplasmic heavy metal sensor [Deltaproteobacteria bacterium]|nr:periplasmic heavy metal sensor [Deltaproteobacteria bacterium]
MNIYKYLYFIVIALSLTANTAFSQLMGMGRGAHGPGMLHGLPLGQLNLSSEQETQIQAIIDSYKDKLKAAFEAQRSAREALTELVESGRTDLTSATDTFGDKAAQKVILKAQVTKEIKSLLTDEQLTELETVKQRHLKHFLSE